MNRFPADHPKPCFFWRRVLALIIDVLILTVIGWGLGSVFFDFLAELGIYGRLIGMIITLLYFGHLNSGPGGGQTIGKRIWRIRVVNGEGAGLPLDKSLGRSLVLFLPFYLNGLTLPGDHLAGILSILLNVIVFGFGIATIYLYIANQRTRQSFHDLLAGSFVVSTETEVEIERNRPFRKRHLAISGGLVAGIVGLFVALPSLVVPQQVSEVLAINQRLNSLETVHVAVVLDLNPLPVEGETSTVQVIANVDREGFDDPKTAQRLAELIILHYHAIDERDELRITLFYGYDIGIARASRQVQRSESIEHWRETLDLETPAGSP